MSKVHDISGERHGRFFVIKRVESVKRGAGGNARFLCLCDCGKQAVVIGSKLISNKVSSCGCLRTESLVKRSTTHGKSKSSVYFIWQNMIQRCKNPKGTGYINYGGRGIKVCERWFKFENFLSDMGLPPTSQHTIERKNTNGNYEPTNCIWATHKEQANNTRGNHVIEYQGQRKTIAQWSDFLGIQRSTLSNRIVKLKWSIKKALNTPTGAAHHVRKQKTS